MVRIVLAFVGAGFFGVAGGGYFVLGLVGAAITGHGEVLPLGFEGDFGPIADIDILQIPCSQIFVADIRRLFLPSSLPAPLLPYRYRLRNLLQLPLIMLRLRVLLYLPLPLIYSHLQRQHLRFSESTRGCRVGLFWRY